MTRATAFQAADAVESTATAFFARRRSGEMDEAEARALGVWLEADPRHRLAFEALERIWSGYEQTRDAPEILALRAQARREPNSRVRGRLARRMAAGLALIAVSGAGAWALYQSPFFTSRAFPDQTFRTEIGQRSTVTLPDGSVVTLNTGTTLRTQASPDKRLIFLDGGQAFFRVAKDSARPFIVHAAGRTITAVGTAFDVRAEEGKFEVTLVEGKVKVAEQPQRTRTTAPAKATELVAGTQLTALDEEHWRVAPADTVKEVAWITGWLEFEDEPLAQVATEIGRYSDRKIVLDDAALAEMPISGRFRAGDLDAFVKAIAIYEVTPVATNAPGVIKLARTSK